MTRHCTGFLAHRLLLATLLFLLAPASLRAQHDGMSSYRIDATHSSVEFSISKWTVTTQHGIFREVDGTIHMDADEPENAVVEVRVHAASLDTRNSGRDRVVRSDDFLDVTRHPYLTFRSTRIRRDGSGTFHVAGHLTIRGVTKRITAPVQFLGIHREAGLGELAAFETELVVSRSEFGVLGSRWSGGRTILGDEVTVRLSIVARRAD